MLSRAFAHPASRVLLLAATFAATVATSAPPPDWSLDSELSQETVTLGPEQTFERKVAVQENVETESASLSLTLDGLSPDGRLSLDVTRDDVQSPRATIFVGAGGKWQPEGSTSTYDDLPTIQQTAFGNGRWVTTVRVTNVGTAPLTFTLKLQAHVYGYDDQPAGAFVKLDRL